MPRTPKKEQEWEPLTAADVAQAASASQTATVTLGNKRAEITYRALTWWERNRCISAATEYVVEKDEKGKDTLRTKFHVETYYEEALKVMIQLAPFPVNTVTLRNLPVELGQQLERLAPNPLDFQAEVTAAKKE